ncbi:D-lyxose/D-mannose family sugar isomerase [bacterium]|nr:D-lyxose/D-mannose family sugar isomerase [bacterium]
MKRSEINLLLEDAKRFFTQHQLHLPPWALWTPSDWQTKGPECDEIVENMLGWDITDFGSGDFEKRGLLLFTLRNGNPARDRKLYAEKIMIVRENQETPMHFHWQKAEDIINRGGGNLVIELHNATEDEDLADTPVQVQVDGVERHLQPGGKVILTPGESICLTQRLYHRFYGEPGSGKILVGEVSLVNDDNCDNRFHEKVGRFPEIEEDAEPKHLLVSDYARFVAL